MLSYAHTVILLTCVTLFTVSFVGNRFLQYHNDIQENELGYDPFTGAVHIMSVLHTDPPHEVQAHLKLPRLEAGGTQ